MPLTLVKVEQLAEYYTRYEWTDPYGNVFRGDNVGPRSGKTEPNHWLFWVKHGSEGHRISMEQFRAVNCALGASIPYHVHTAVGTTPFITFSDFQGTSLILDGWAYGIIPKWFVEGDAIPSALTQLGSSTANKRCKKLQFGPYPSSSIEDLKPQAVSAARKEISSTFRAWPRCVNDGTIEHALRLEEQQTRIGPTYMVYVQCPECK